MKTFGQGIYHISSDYLNLLLELAFERGIDSTQLLADSGLPEHVLLETNVPIGHESYLKVLHRFCEQTQDLSIALEYGKRMTLSKHGALGYAAQYSATIDEATLKVMRYVETRAQVFELDRSGGADFRRLTIRPRFQDETVANFLSLAFLSSIETICRTLTGSFGQQAHSTICTKAKVDLSQQKILPGCQIISHAENNSLTWPLAALTHPLPFFNPNLATIAEQQLQKALADMGEKTELTYQVGKILQREIEHMPTAEQVAKELHLSSATLNRRLKAANSSFQQLKDNIRQQQACHLLSQSKLSIEQIAERLGFSDASNFAKAFKQWQGVAPSRFRKA